jgi:LacI family transcriptional regulator
MRRTRKIAMVGQQWHRGHARLFAGGLQHANAHPSLNVLIRPFALTCPPALLAASIERWGADGIYGMFSDKQFHALKPALKRPIPIVSNSGSTDFPGVIQVVGDAGLFVEMAVGHFRHLGLKSFGMLLTTPRPGPKDSLTSSFRKLTEPHTSILTLPTRADRLLDPEWKSQRVPTPLATWLGELPKPCGVLCPCLGSGKFLIECCARLGLQVPGDIAILGSDETDMCLSCTPSLTSILPNLEMLGSESVRVLLGILEGITPPTPTIRIDAFDLTVRESTGQRPAMICDVAGALEYIKANATKGLSVTQLIRETHQPSLPTFYKIFRDATGRTPAQAIRERQLEEVRRLLATTQLPVAVVSTMAGFSSSNVMGRLFLKVEGVPPLEYRKRENKG